MRRFRDLLDCFCEDKFYFSEIRRYEDRRSCVCDRLKKLIAWLLFGPREDNPDDLLDRPELADRCVALLDDAEETGGARQGWHLERASAVMGRILEIPPVLPDLPLAGAYWRLARDRLRKAAIHRSMKQFDDQDYQQLGALRALRRALQYATI